MLKYPIYDFISPYVKWELRFEMSKDLEDSKRKMYTSTTIMSVRGKRKQKAGVSFIVKESKNGRTLETRNW